MNFTSLLIALLPALLLVGALLQGRYPGERVLERLRRIAGGRRRGHTAGRLPRGAPRRARRRSGQLLAESLAGRGPPGARPCT